MPRVRRPSLPGVLALILMAVPMGAATASYFSRGQAQPLSETPQRPSLAFHQYLVDLGAVRPTGELAARFSFSNMGSETVVIQEIIPSCGCLKPMTKQKTYLPGQTGDFLARIHTANEAPGPREYTLRVKYTDPEPREELLTFRVKLPENQVLIRPHSLIFLQLNGNESTQDVTITDQRSRTLQLQNVVTSNPFVKAELGPKSIDDQGRLQQKVKITVSGKVPSRRFHTLISVTTDDPGYRTLTIPLMIQGPTPSVSQNKQSGSPKFTRTAQLPGTAVPR